MRSQLLDQHRLERHGVVIASSGRDCVIEVQQRTCGRAGGAIEEGGCVGGCVRFRSNGQVDVHHDGAPGDRVTLDISGVGMTFGAGLVFGLPVVMVLFAMLVLQSVAAAAAGLVMGLAIVGVCGKLGVADRALQLRVAARAADGVAVR